MSCAFFALCTALALTAAQRPITPASGAPKSFAEQAKIAGSAPALFLAEWIIVPGLEYIDDSAEEVAELKGFSAELVKVLRAHDARSRSAGLKYLAGLARMVRTSAWWRDRDDGDDLFSSALGKHATPIRTGLETAFKNTTGNDRVLAAVALLALADDHQPALDSVVDELRCSDATRRQEACEWIGRVRLSRPRLVTVLAAVATDKEIKVRRAAVTALLQTGPKAAPAAPAVLAYLNSREATMDEVLREMRLAPVLMNIPTVSGECSAIGASLADLKPAVSAVIELLNHGDANKRHIALTCLAHLGAAARTALPAIEPYLMDADSDTRLIAATTVLCIDAQCQAASKILVAAIKSDNRDTRARALALCAELAPKGQKLVLPLIESLKYDEATRVDAARALGKMGSLAEPAIPRLTELLTSKHTDDRDMRVQYVAACALVGIGNRGLTVLLDNLGKAPATVIRSAGYAAMYLALAECKDDNATIVRVLTRALDDKNPGVRMQAAAALGRLKRLATPAREALLRESRRRDSNDIFCASRTLAGWALTQLSR